ncbi:MAG: glycerol-3-phosphate dehydrogenase/oxidase [Mycobacteriales bacterium]
MSAISRAASAHTAWTPYDAGVVQLSPQRRAEDLRRLAGEEFDLVVVGGGVTGAGAALDAATRGLRVAIVEARDWASGTSSRSSKLIHGGLRYLEQLDFGLVREALQERANLLGTIAPHLVQPVSFLLPLNHRLWQRIYYGAGIAVYDVLGATLGNARGLPHQEQLTRKQARALFPSLRKDALVGAIRYWDAQVDDARFVLTLVRTAVQYGAVAASSTRALDFRRDGERVTGLLVRDLESGREIEVRAKAVIAATGVWSDDVGAMLDDPTSLRVRASKGVHIVVPRDRLHGETGLILRTETSVLFTIPWGQHWIIGTTDTEWELDRAHPAASSSDIDYVLEHVNRVLERPLSRADIEGVYAGLRPLLSGESDATSKLSREHAVVRPSPGLVLVAGGKYTTYRVMAADAVDAIRDDVPGVPASRTDRVPLLGAHGFESAWRSRGKAAARHGLDVARMEHLLHRYGTLTGELLRLIAERPELAAALPGAPEYLVAEAFYAARSEGALHLDDILTRRTRISIETEDRGTAAAESIARLVAPVLGWDEESSALEVEHYLARVEAERESQQQPDDRTADAARLGAPDVRGADVRGADVRREPHLVAVPLDADAQ